MKKLMQIALLSGGLFSAITAFAGWSSFNYANTHNKVFATPSGNIVCGGDNITSSGNALTCYIQNVAKKPAKCSEGVGLEFTLNQTGKGKLQCTNHEFEPENEAEDITKIIPYGSSINGNGWTCTSQTTGMRCVNKSGHGFQLSKSKQTLF